MEISKTWSFQISAKFRKKKKKTGATTHLFSSVFSTRFWFWGSDKSPLTWWDSFPLYIFFEISWESRRINHVNFFFLFCFAYENKTSLPSRIVRLTNSRFDDVKSTPSKIAFERDFLILIINLLQDNCLLTIGLTKLSGKFANRS